MGLPKKPKPCQLAQLFGKKLASSDEPVRKEGFKILTEWMENNYGNPEAEPDAGDLLKIWRALFFNMWMSDKRPVQQQTAAETCALGRIFSDRNLVMWISTFWKLMSAQWSKLDRYRMNKYLLFIRIFIAETFDRIKAAQEPSVLITEVSAIYTDLLISGPFGVTIQIIRVWWEEITATWPDGNCDFQSLGLLLVDPFFQLLCARQTDSRPAVVKALEESIVPHNVENVPKNLTELFCDTLASKLNQRLTDLEHSQKMSDDTRARLFAFIHHLRRDNYVELERRVLEQAGGEEDVEKVALQALETVKNKVFLNLKRRPIEEVDFAVEPAAAAGPVPVEQQLTEQGGELDLPKNFKKQKTVENSSSDGSKILKKDKMKKKKKPLNMVSTSTTEDESVQLNELIEPQHAQQKIPKKLKKTEKPAPAIVSKNIQDQPAVIVSSMRKHEVSGLVGGKTKKKKSVTFSSAPDTVCPVPQAELESREGLWNLTNLFNTGQLEPFQVVLKVQRALREGRDVPKDAVKLAKEIYAALSQPRRNGKKKKKAHGRR
jgi:hypothetical protein